MTADAEAVRANIVSSFEALGRGRGLRPIPKDLIIMDEQDESDRSPPSALLYGMALMPTTPLPWFFRLADGTIDSPQRPLFGLYVLRAAWRGCAIGARFFQAGDLLEESRFFAAAIVCHYTAAFHLLEGFLALHGRLFFDDPTGQPRIHSREGATMMDHLPLDDRRRSLLATWEPAGGWSFDLTTSSHARRWRELRDVLLEGEVELPPFLETFLTYITGYGEYQLTDRQELLTEGTARLAAGRHEAMYGGFGDDPYAFDLLANREISFDPGLSSKATAYRDLARGFLDLCSAEALAVRKAIDDGDWAKANVNTAASLMTPPFELPTGVRGEAEINERLGEILTWWLVPSSRVRE